MDNEEALTLDPEGNDSSLLVTIGYGIVSFVLLVFASWCVGEGGEILGEKYDASIIGGLVIAWLNTAPEAIFFVSAMQSQNPEFAVGAVSGSTIVVCTVAVGACLWIGSRARRGRGIQLQPAVKEQCMILAGSVIIPLLTIVWGFNVFCAAGGAVVYSLFLLYSLFRSHVQGRDVEEGASDSESDDDEKDEPLWKGVSYLVVGGVLIIAFSNPFITSVVETSNAWELSPTLLAFFLAPIASEAPEILEAISLSRKGNSQNINIAYSNLVGGTITKTTLLTGLFSFFGLYYGFEWVSPDYALSLALYCGCAFCAAGIGLFVNRQYSQHGLFLFALFVVCGYIQYTYNGHVQNPDVTHISPQV